MSSIVLQLAKRGLIKPPSYATETQYEVLSGSISYGVSSDISDSDIVGFCIPSKEVVFPHLAGEVFRFGKEKQRFDQFQQHHIDDKESGRQYDISVYNIVRFFHLCMDNNPNMVDALFVPQRCILHITKIGHMVRDHRREFLHKGAWHRFKGYAYSQLHKARTKNPEGKRKAIVEKFGYDVKFAYHIVRLLDEVEQILSTGDLDLERCREQCKAIRAGEVSLASIEEHFEQQSKLLEEVYQKSTLPYGPDEERIKGLLLMCLEEFYGSLDKCIVIQPNLSLLLQEMQSVIDKYK
jgi:predicted nucleotidyltransferase